MTQPLPLQPPPQPPATPQPPGDPQAVQPAEPGFNIAGPTALGRWLRIEPAGWRVLLQAGLSLLEAAQQAGVHLPRSCRNGTCRACLCRRLAGATRHRIDWPGLSAEEREAGWILPCVAEALPSGPGCAGDEIVIEQPAARRRPDGSGQALAQR